MASALCLALESRLSGPVNIGSGTGISIMDLARLAAGIIPANPALVQAASELDVDASPTVIASMERLAAIGWSPATPLAEGLQRLKGSLLGPG